MLSLFPFILVFFIAHILPSACVQLPFPLVEGLSPTDLQKFDFHYTGASFFANNESMLMLFDHKNIMQVIDTPANFKLFKCAFSQSARIFSCVFWEQATLILRSYSVFDGKLISAVRLHGLHGIPNRLTIMKFCSEDKLLALVFNATVPSEFDGTLSDKKVFLLYRVPHYHLPLITLTANSIIDVQSVDYQSSIEVYYFERAIRTDKVVIRALYRKLRSDDEDESERHDPNVLYWKEVGHVPYKGDFSGSMEFRGEIMFCLDDNQFSMQAFGIAPLQLQDEMADYIHCEQGEKFMNLGNMNFILVSKNGLRLFNHKRKVKNSLVFDNATESRFLYGTSAKAALVYFKYDGIYFHELKLEEEQDVFSPLKKLEINSESVPEPNTCRKDGFFPAIVERSLKDLDLQYQVMIYRFELVIDTARKIFGKSGPKKALIVGEFEGESMYMHRNYLIDAPGSAIDVVYVPKEDSKNFYQNFTRNLHRIQGKSKDVQIAIRTGTLSVIAKESREKRVLYDYIFYSPSLHGENMKPSLEILFEMLRKGGVLVIDRSQLVDIDSTFRHDPNVAKTFLNSYSKKLKVHVGSIYMVVEKIQA